MTRTQKVQSFETHRCKGLLDARCSIRRLQGDLLEFIRLEGMHCAPGTNAHLNDEFWHLFVQEHDFEWDSTYMRHVARVRFCPFCGERLPE